MPCIVNVAIGPLIRGAYWTAHLGECGLFSTDSRARPTEADWYPFEHDSPNIHRSSWCIL
jgi:hypothetical protein